MAATLSATKYARQSIKDLLSGYIREETHDHKQMNSLHIPQSIVDLCLQFYYIMTDVWDENCLSDAISLQDNTIILSQDKSCMGTSSFLSEIIDSGSFEWKFKCNKLSKPSSSTIGIYPLHDKRNPKDTTDHNCFCGYATGASVGIPTINAKFWSERYIPVKDGDILRMKLDLNLLELTFKLNESEDISKSMSIKPGEYRAVVNLSVMDTSVTLLETD